jgi:hypothetical protein
MCVARRNGRVNEPRIYEAVGGGSRMKLPRTWRITHDKNVNVYTDC